MRKFLDDGSWIEKEPGMQKDSIRTMPSTILLFSKF